MPYNVAARIYHYRETIGNSPRVVSIGNNEVMFRSCGSCGGELCQSYFVTKDLNEALPVNQAHWLLNHQAMSFALEALGLPKRGEA